MTTTAITHKEFIIKSLLDGKRLSDIARQLGVSHQALSAPLQDDPDYLAAMDASLDVRMDQREDELESAQDQLAVARARELLSHARFRAERLAPARWGKVAESAPVSVTLTLSSSTIAKASELLKHQPATITQEPDGEG